MTKDFSILEQTFLDASVCCIKTQSVKPCFSTFCRVERLDSDSTRCNNCNRRSSRPCAFSCAQWSKPQR